MRKRGQAYANGNEVLDRVSIAHRSYDPLSNVTLFSDGTDGWHPEFRFAAGEKPRKVTPLMFYRWRMFQRRGEFSMLLHGCRPFQHYLVDQFCKMEAEKMSHLLHNQQRIRAENYTALRELLGDSGGPGDESEAVRSGRLVVLPST